MKLGDKVGQPWPSIPTGLLSLDEQVLGCGGMPEGRIIEIFGPESSGKTTIALWTIAKAQKRGKLCAFVDAEHALDPTYAFKLGVDVDNLLVSQPDSGEQALDTVIALVETGALGIIVVDSVAALVPQAELDGEMGQSHMGLQARLMSQAMRKLRGICNVTKTTVIFINQIREKIGVMFGSPETTTGGRALKFYASIRLDVRKVGGTDGQIKSGDTLIGHKTKIKAAKNKMAAPFRETVIDLIYGEGYDELADFVTYASTIGVIERSGAWYNYKDTRLGQGLAKTIEAVRLNDKWKQEIEADVKALREKNEDKAVL